jgi:hypothetical protein
MFFIEQNTMFNTYVLQLLFFFCDPLEDKILYSYIVQSLFVLRPVADLDFVSVFNLWAQPKTTHFYS